MLVKILAIIGLIGLFYLFGTISVRHELFPVPQLIAIKRSLFPPQPQGISYPDVYADKVDYFNNKAKPLPASIVMVGDSHIENGNWVELLGRTDLLNRGISRETSDGLLKRMDSIYRIHPKVAFVMIGINDLLRGKTVEDLFSNYRLILEGLVSHHIKPVVHAIPLRNNPPYDEDLNAKIKKFNSLLESYCEEKGFVWIDLNRRLAPNGRLDTAYTWDGLHLTYEAYMIWADTIGLLLQGLPAWPGEGKSR
jgi:lysophospholipase L1-like esterase